MAENDWQAHCLLTTEQMAAADRAAIAAGTPSIALMEAAGAAVAREIRLRWRPRPATILCGPGNNGGDGFVVARLLLDAGWPVAVLHAPLPERLQGDARAACERWQAAAGTENRPAATSEWRADGLETAELIVDALFGGGLTRPLAGRPADLLERAAARRRDAGAPLIAIDVPSGVDGDTGACLGPVAQANLTVTFFRAKPGHFLLPGREMCGTLAVHDIGIADSALDRNRNPGSHSTRRRCGGRLCGRRRPAITNTPAATSWFWPGQCPARRFWRRAPRPGPAPAW